MATTDTTLTVTAWKVRQDDAGKRILVMTATGGGATFETLLPDVSIQSA